MPGWRYRHGLCQGGQPRRIRRFVEPALLLLLHCQPTHGYALVEGLNELGLEDYPADVSAIYRVLYDLEAKGMLVSKQETEQSGGPPRRVYSLTELGDAYLSAWVQDLQATDVILHRFLDAYNKHRQQHETGEIPNPFPAEPEIQQGE